MNTIQFVFDLTITVESFYQLSSRRTSVCRDYVYYRNL